MKILTKPSVANDGTYFDSHGDGPVVVLIHGLGLNRHMWQWQISALRQQYRVLSFDLFGHGDSPKPDRSPDLKLFSEQILNLLEQLEIQRCVLVGFSLGGMIARRFAQDYPQFLNALVILNSPHKRSAHDQQAILKRVEQVRLNGPASTVDAALERWFTKDWRAENPAIIKQVKDWVLSNDAIIYPQNYSVLASGIDEIIKPEVPISCPTLIISAQHDYGQPPEMAQAIAADIPDSITRVIPHLRHMALVEDPDTHNKILLEFLNSEIDD